MQGKTKIMFDTNSKSYWLALESGSVAVPRHERKSLEIVRPIVALQMFINPGTPLCVELLVTDSENTQKKLVFDKSKGIVKGNTIAKLPNFIFRKGAWVNLAFDLDSLFSLCFCKGKFVTLDRVYIFGSVYLRRIVSVISPVSEYFPKSFEQKSEVLQEVNRFSYTQMLLQQNSPFRNEKSPRSLQMEQQLTRKTDKESYRKMFKSPQPPVIKHFESLASNNKHSFSFANSNKKALRKPHIINVFASGATEKIKLLKQFHNKEETFLSYFNQLSSQICTHRPITPPFVNSNSQVYYNPIEKKYNNL